MYSNTSRLASARRSLKPFQKLAIKRGVDTADSGAAPLFANNRLGSAEWLFIRLSALNCCECRLGAHSKTGSKLQMPRSEVHLVCTYDLYQHSRTGVFYAQFWVFSLRCRGKNLVPLRGRTRHWSERWHVDARVSLRGQFAEQSDSYYDL